MKNKNLIVSFAFTCGIGITTVFGQEALTALGGDATGSNGSVSYSVGQVAYTTVSGTNGSSAQGVQHAFEIYATLDLDESIEVNVEINAFPNPTVDFLTVSIEGDLPADLSFQLIDNLGRLITKDSIYDQNTQIEMSSLPVGNYFLNISSSSRTIKTFKIIKSK